MKTSKSTWKWCFSWSVYGNDCFWYLSFWILFHSSCKYAEIGRVLRMFSVDGIMIYNTGSSYSGQSIPEWMKRECMCMSMSTFVIILFCCFFSLYSFHLLHVYGHFACNLQSLNTIATDGTMHAILQVNI